MAALGALLLSLVLGLQGASSAAVLPRQYAPDPDAPPPTTAQCIDRSFTNPNWLIVAPMLITVNGSTGGSQGDFRFLATNMATGVTTECVQRNIELDPKGPGALDIWHNCSAPDLFFQFNLTSLDMRLKGSWKCDNSSNLVFAANGTWETPLIQGCLDDPKGTRGQEILCIMGNSQVSASLSSPVTIAPQLPLLPWTPYEPPAKCVDRSIDPEWIVENFTYHQSEKSYSVSLNLTSIATGETSACSVQVENSKARSKGSVPWVKCNQPAAAGAKVSSTEISIDTTYGIFGVRQTWKCTDGKKGVDPDQFTGTGYLVSPLVCGNSTSSNPGYSCTLSPPATGNQTRFSGYWPDAPTIPHTFYERSCTIGSFVNMTSLALRNLKIETILESNNRTTQVGTFSLTNKGTLETYQFNRVPFRDDAGVWQQGFDGDEPLPWQLVDFKYYFSRRSHRLGIRISWYCDDRDPSHAIRFDATAVAEDFPVDKCQPGTGEVKESCTLPVAEVAIPVENLSWEATDGPMDRGPVLPWI